jgi:electron transfer flavoprotein beta subunit
MGANEAFRINAHPVNSMFVAQQIANHAKNNSYDLILTGRESIDYNGGMVQGLIAGILNLPIINVVTELEFKGDSVEANRDIDGGRETVSTSLPCIISAQKDLCEPRIPNMRGIMMARSKPLTVIEPEGDFNYTQVVKYELPPTKTGVKLIDAENAESLIDILHNEEKLF